MSSSRTSFPQPITTFVEEFRSAGPARFADDIDCPMLIVRSIDRADEDSPAFATRVLGRYVPTAAPPAPEPACSDGLAIGDVLRVEKRPGGAFPERIGLGRAPNVDVRIALPLVSKFHAFFETHESTWTITDAGSSNGTFVRGLRVAPRRATAIFDGDDLGLGPYRLTFYLPSSFVFLVRGRASGR